MADFELDTKGFERGLKDTFNKIDAGTHREVKRVGGVVQDASKATVAVDTGETRDSIQISTGSDKRGPVVILKAGGAALALEFGTEKMDAQPFMRRAMRLALKEIRRPI